MAEAFSYFSYNNNLERSFLSSLSQILQESNDTQEGQNRDVQLLETDKSDENEENMSFLSNSEEKKNSIEGSDTESSKSGSGSSNTSTNISGENQEDLSDDDQDIFVQLLATKLKEKGRDSSLKLEDTSSNSNSKKNNKKPGKVVPLFNKRKRVKFTPDHKFTPDDGKMDDDIQQNQPNQQTMEEEEEDIKEVDISDESTNNDNELEALVKQLVLLENEATKAQQFLTFIQQHNCFDKQDHKAVHNFLELIEQEKNSLVLVLSNYSSHVQPLITMMTIAERRLTLLDSTQFITQNSTLHTTFLEKQRMLQDVIQQATEHVYGQR